MLAGAAFALLFSFTTDVLSTETWLANLFSTIRTIFGFNGKILTIWTCQVSEMLVVAGI